MLSSIYQGAATDGAQSYGPAHLYSWVERGTTCVNTLPKDAILKCGQCWFRAHDPWVVNLTPYHYATEAIDELFFSRMLPKVNFIYYISNPILEFLNKLFNKQISAKRILFFNISSKIVALHIFGMKSATSFSIQIPVKTCCLCLRNSTILKLADQFESFLNVDSFEQFDLTIPFSLCETV